MSEKVELRVATSAGHSIKVKVPGGTSMGRVKEKMLPSLKELMPGVAWEVGNCWLSFEGRAVGEGEKAAEYKGKEVSVVSGKRPGGSPKAPVSAPPPDKQRGRGRKNPPPNPNPNPSPDPSPAATPTTTSSAAIAHSRRKSRSRSRSPPPVRSDRVVLTVNFRTGGHLNFKLSPYKTTFARLKELVEINAGKEGKSLRFKRGDEHFELEPNDTLADGGITTSCAIDCLEVDRLPTRAALRETEAPRLEPIRLTLEGVGGERMPMQVTHSASIGSIARSIEDCWGIPTDMVCVVWLGRVLSHSDTVSDCGFADDATLQIVTRPTGRPTYHTRTLRSDPVLLTIKSLVDGKEYRFPNIRPTAPVTRIKHLLAQSASIPTYEQVLLTASNREIGNHLSLSEPGLLDDQPWILQSGSLEHTRAPVMSPPEQMRYPAPHSSYAPEYSVRTEVPQVMNIAAAPQMPFTEDDAKVLQTLIAERKDASFRQPLPPPPQPLVVENPTPKPTVPTPTTSFSKETSFTAPSYFSLPKREEEFNPAMMSSATERGRDLDTEYRMRAAREDSCVDEIMDKYKLSDTDSLEAATLKRMEAARRADLLQRRNDGEPLAYRPIVPGVGLEDTNSPTSYPSSNPYALPLSETRHPHDTLALPSTTRSPYRDSPPRVWSSAL